MRRLTSGSLRQFAFVHYSMLLLGFSACTTPSSLRTVRFVSFEEPQQNWPTQPYGLVHVVDQFPIYGLHQLPPAPYEVRGRIDVSDPAGSALDEIERAVAKTARQEGGEAAILQASGASTGHVSVRGMEYEVIQFKTNGLAAVLDRINVYLALHPDLTNQVDRQSFERLRNRSGTSSGSTAP